MKMQAKYLKNAPNAIERAALKAAELAANKTHDEYLDASQGTATMCVRDDVIAAAEAAYSRAGGRRKLAVCGRGNSTHPVIDIYCRIERL
jgi:hypothetical protein